MAMEYIGTDWEQSADPYVDRQFDLDDIWPNGVGSDSAGGDKELLVDGNHPIQAIGPKANREQDTPVGVVVTVTADADRAVLNTGRHFITRQKVMNILTYSAGDPATWVTSVAVGQPVYVDDSPDLPTDVCLSMSPLNDAGSTNPLAGWIVPAQNEFDDTGVGGASAYREFPVTVAEETTEVEFAVMLK